MAPAVEYQFKLTEGAEILVEQIYGKLYQLYLGVECLVKVEREDGTIVEKVLPSHASREDVREFVDGEVIANLPPELSTEPAPHAEPADASPPEHEPEQVAHESEDHQ